MGYWIEIHDRNNSNLSREEVVDRFIELGLDKHPDYQDEFLINGGVLSINDESEIQEGKWASIRLSWGASSEDCSFLINVAEKIGGNIFDPSVSQYVNKESLEKTLKAHTENFDLVKEILSVSK
jgi:hypothetical protein